MDEVLRLIRTPVFWFVTVFVGLLLSVFGAAIYDALKTLAGKFSARQRERNEEEEERIEYEAHICAMSTKLIVLLRGQIDDFEASASTSSIFGLALLFIGGAYAALPGLLVAISNPQVYLQSDAFGMLFGIPTKDLPGALSDGWYPLTMGRSILLAAMLCFALGYYVVISGARQKKKANYGRRILSRVWELVEEDLDVDDIDDEDMDDEDLDEDGYDPDA